MILSNTSGGFRAFDGRFPIWGKTQGYTALWEKRAQLSGRAIKLTIILLRMANPQNFAPFLAILADK